MLDFEFDDDGDGLWDGGTNDTLLVDYTYDDNNSLVTKKDLSDNSAANRVKYDYTYNAEDRLITATQTLDPDGAATPNGSASYTYDHNGIKVGITPSSGTGTDLLIDPSGGHTGYAQVFEERTDGSGVGTLTRSYVLGDDVLSQATTASSAHYLLYDGHGSTRLLTDTQATPAIAANYDFDAYGNALGFDPAAAATPLLYAGEYLAAAAGQYYLRARHYDTANGRFNRVDPFAGNNDDPQSLHKYAYAHANPASHIDPSGLSIMDVLSSISIMTVVVGGFLGAAIGAVVGGGIAGYLHIVENETFEGFWDAVLNGALWGALYGALIGAAGAVSVVLLAITIATVFGINLYHAIPILMSPDIKPQTKIALIIILIVTAWLGTRAVVGAALRPKVVNPRASLPEGEHANFSGQAKPVVYTERSGALFRLSPKGGERGSYWGKPAPESELVWRQKMAWEEEFGNAESLTILRIPKGLGLKGFEGETAGRGPAYPGGGRQTYFPKEDIPLDWIQTVDFQATQQIPASTSGSGSAGGGGGG